jgi:hypothetical protein
LRNDLAVFDSVDGLMFGIRLSQFSAPWFH